MRPFILPCWDCTCFRHIADLVNPPSNYARLASTIELYDPSDPNPAAAAGPSASAAASAATAATFGTINTSHPSPSNGANTSLQPPGANAPAQPPQSAPPDAPPPDQQKRPRMMMHNELAALLRHGSSIASCPHPRSHLPHPRPAPYRPPGIPHCQHSCSSYGPRLPT
jgi:hypothetical protein